MNIYDEIKTIVADNYEWCNIKKLPIDCDEILNKFNIKTVKYSSLSAKKRDACIKLSNDGFNLNNVIYYNDDMAETRIRFSKMHELGHIQLGHNSENNDAYEKQANFFARHMLVPMIIIRNDNLHNDPLSIQKKCYVSSDVAEYSLQHYQKWHYFVNVNGLKEYDKKILNLFNQPKKNNHTFKNYCTLCGETVDININNRFCPECTISLIRNGRLQFQY